MCGPSTQHAKERPAFLAASGEQSLLDPNSGKWIDSGPRREKLAANPADEFLARGIEHGRFLGSMGPRTTPGAREASVPPSRPGPSARRGPTDAGRANAFSAQIPLYDDYN